MQHFLTFVVCAVFTLRSVAATEAPTPREQHTAKCVAALEANTDELAAQVKAGRPDLRPLLLDRLKRGAAFIGAAYLQGKRDEERAKRFLDAALEAQKALSKPALACAPDRRVRKRGRSCWPRPMSSVALWYRTWHRDG
jgi:hypothetical protein